MISYIHIYARVYVFLYVCIVLRGRTSVDICLQNSSTVSAARHCIAFECVCVETVDFCVRETIAVESRSLICRTMGVDVTFRD